MRPAIDGRRAARDLARLYGSPPPGYDEAQGDDLGFAGVSAGERFFNWKSTTTKLPNNWRGRLPLPASWFAFNVPSMVIRDGIGIAPCPMHPDRERSFTVNLTGSKGTWQCNVCGRGDMLGFAMRRYGMKFADAVRLLVLGVAR